ncbi:cupin domain-containing protein [Streptomyces luteireticuli]|uniref:JmjC domain-containing protein n=1 Tax=Streptomyces luteireticuli TaxID=173858 RepID=A0ABN0Z9L9_9ACTN
MTDALSWAERLGGDRFLAQTFSRSHFVSLGSVGAFDSLLTWDDVNTILSTHRLQPPRLRLAAGGDVVDPDRYTTTVTNRRGASWHVLRPAELHARLAEGASLVLDSVEELHPPVRAAAAALEQLTRMTVQANLYASWTPQPGFGRHWDDHAVVVCQISGSKRWKIWEPTREDPGWVDVDMPEEPEGDPLADIVLSAGDLLYLPRGWWHEVAADAEASLHLTFGLTGPSTGADLLHWLVDSLREQPILRQDVPKFGSADDTGAYVARLRLALGKAFDDPGLVDRWADAVDTTHPGRVRPSLPYVTGVPSDALLSVVLTCPRAQVDTTDTGTVTLRAGGTRFEFARQVRPVLAALLPGEPVELVDLARRAGLTVADVAEVATVLVQGQVAAVAGRWGR